MNVPYAKGYKIAPMGEMSAIYHFASGQSHLVASPVPEILDILDGSPCDEKAIFDQLSAIFDVDNDDDLRILITQQMDELYALGLIERADNV
ncbi:hypothetical protein LPB140_11200 [Sphingorhabdus lutea]|uniref:HPr-rel-A system PqqD family peptide chaperone n=1 Tax=Sphingorhabdus lutea TaxID=1913578 RepID=A0A1L3JF98_9SPHN|nr:HPr-rel-A system PqqD family peptide chaperone [Sphingorhabdus lutea]APG63818.1 hypothetical protein LPB140_11200 [Sphingorhabdus lutea]